MFKKRKKLLFAFIILVIAVLLFSVIGIITVYLAGPQQHQPNYDSAAYQQAIEEAQALVNSGIQLKATDEDGNEVTITGNVVSAPAVGTGN